MYEIFASYKYTELISMDFIQRPEVCLFFDNHLFYMK